MSKGIPCLRMFAGPNGSGKNTLKSWIAEITEGKMLEMKTELMPAWFKKYLWDKFFAEAKHKS